MKVTALKASLFFLFLGIANVAYGSVGDCLMHVFKSEINEGISNGKSKDISNYFDKNTPEDCNKIYEAWEILYTADTRIDRLDIEILIELADYIRSSKKTIEVIVKNIQDAGGYLPFKKTLSDNVLAIKTGLKYKYSKGYVYAPEFEIDIDGSKIIEHFMKKEGEEDVLCGISKISPNKVLNNMFGFTEEFQTEENFKTIYNALLKEDIESISSYYIKGQFPDETTDFMEEFNLTGDKVKAAFTTLEGFVLKSKGFIPTNIEVSGAGISLLWVKKGANKIESESWVNKLPINLQIFIAGTGGVDGEFYKLFKNADESYRNKLTKSWELLNTTNIEVIKKRDLMYVSKIVDRFIYGGKEGFEALALLFDQPLTLGHQKTDLISEFDILYEELNVIFNNKELSISLSCTEGKESVYKAIVVDGLGEAILSLQEGIYKREKFFNTIDDSYTIVGELERANLYMKGKEIGFKSADVINISSRAKYQYQREGYVIFDEEVITSLGVKRKHHFVQKGDEAVKFATSRISPNGILSIEFNIPKDLREKEISKKTYTDLLKNDIKSISSSYIKGNPPFDPINYNAFMKAINSGKTKEQAALSTPEGKVLGAEWDPLKIDIQENFVHVTWARK